MKFIGTATIGFDHIDTEYCKEAGITWKNCPGCNAGAVEQYVHAVLSLLEKEKGMDLANTCIGIVGVGHVGSRIMRLAGRLGGKYKTFHLADRQFFESVRKRPVIINTSRGEVIDTEAILDALNKGLISEAVIDVWENEPNINLELLKRVFVGTPHIAGYSADGKLNATTMTLKSLCDFFGIDMNIDLSLPEDLIKPESSVSENDILLNYNPKND